MHHDKCYVFQPEDARPTKRRRTEARGLHASWPIRRRAYEKAWQQQQARINAALEEIHATTVTEIQSYLDEAASNESPSRIPTGIILAGPGSASQTSLLHRLSTSTPNEGRRVIVSLEPGAAINLKAALKAIIQRATARSATADEPDDDLVQTSHKGPRLLSYDLQILLDHVKARGITQVVLAFHNTEAFLGDVLSELLEHLACWRDRIPFACLLHLATAVDSLQQRLSRAAVRSVEGRLFDAAPAQQEVEAVFSAITAGDATLWLGPSLASFALDRHADYLHDIGGLVDTVKYAYMSGFYANPLTLFLDPSLACADVPPDHFAALRNTPSFRHAADQLLADGRADALRNLLNDDAALFAFAREHIASGRAAMRALALALDAIRLLQRHIPGVPQSSKSALYVQATAGQLHDSPLLRSLRLSTRKAPADTTLAILQALSALASVGGLQDSPQLRSLRNAERHAPPSDDAPRDALHALSPPLLGESFRTRLLALTAELQHLLTQSGGDGGSGTDPEHTLRSADDLAGGGAGLRTTVVAQRVGLSRQRAQLSRLDAAYTAIVHGLTDAVDDMLAAALVRPAALVLRECFVYDLRSPHREALTSRPRGAVERALAAPHDYLDCECCGSEGGDGDVDRGEKGGDATLAASQPATAVLYQLYLESGSLMNAGDMWLAFRAVMGEKEGEEWTMALFQRGLAELRYLGMVRGTRKRADHVAKVAWRGL